MRPIAGILFKIGSALAFTLMSAGIKLGGERFPVGQIVFFRSFFALAPLLLWLGWRGDLIGAIRTSDVKGHFLRGLAGGTAMFASFAALSYLPLSETIALGYTSPLITVLLAAVLLKEPVSLQRWAGVLVGFMGVLVMVAPQLGEDASGAGLDVRAGIGVGLSLLAACCTAAAMIQVRRLSVTENTGAIVFYFSLLTTVLGLLTGLFGWRWPSLGEGALLILVGVLGGIGQILLTESYRQAPASLIAPFEYTTMIWAVVIGWLAFEQVPGISLIAGALVVAGAGILVVWRVR